MTRNYEVVVIGGGPVGTVALALLGHAGIHAVGIERDVDLWSQARAVHFDGETMRALQGIGIGDQVLARCRPMTNVRMENEAGETLMAQPTGQRGPQAWHDDVMFHQPEVDALLRAEVERLPGVELRLGTTLVGLEQDDRRAHCRVQNADGTSEVLAARWVIGCDGAWSTVRGLLGIPLESLGTDDPWLVVDGCLRDSPGIPGDMVFLGHYTRPALWVRLTGDRVRMEFKIMPGDDRKEIVTPAAIARISRGVLTPENFTPDRTAVYTFRALVAERWRVGNVFLAGDASHQAPPLFGQGLCAGLRDVVNLAWKLRLVATGRASEDLLDTYESERRPHARYWVERAATMAGLIQTTDPDTAAGRDAHLRANPAAAAPPPAPPLGPGLHTGARDERAGRLSIQPVLADGQRLDDLVGVRFLLATSPQLLDGLAPDTRAAVEADPETVVLTAPKQVGQLLASVEAPAVVVRPDRYILGVADTAADLESLLRLLPMTSPRGDAAAVPVPPSR
ncbi:bifunctional 3-(3-hydroxy-phenyl)propionate/3-hydroxycinnamic acid hydroxylase [Phytohabitans rumicis]